MARIIGVNMWACRSRRPYSVPSTQYFRLTLAILAAVGCFHDNLISPAAAQNNLDLSPITERHEMIPMRDGQRLSAYLYFPPGNGPWPVVFEQRYADLRGAGTRRAAARLAEAGYVVALVNFRGTHLSEGTWVGYRALGWGELKDGYDTCEWLATQKWSTGNVGSFGSSQGGYAQNFLAVTQPPHLKCQYMVDTGLSLFHEGYRIGGTTRPQRFLAMASNCRNPDDNRKLLEEWFRHPNYDDYWRQEDCSLHFDKMNVPCFTIGSWYDFMNQGSIASFIGRQHKGGPNSRGKQQLVIGPWLHGRLNKTNKVGDLVYPENAIWPEHEHMVRWFDHWLKGKDTGVEREPAVRYYVMGATGERNAPGNAWREADDWPPKATSTEYFLHPGSYFATYPPPEDGGSTSYVSDPVHPMQIMGTSFPGARDARHFEQQPDVITFSTSWRLSEPVEWTGRVRAELYVSSTARDTDFLVRVCDVYPDGRSILICDYPRRARYRNGFETEALLQKIGQVHNLEFDVGWISHVFNRGHQIRITVASTGAPLYEPNPQTGGKQTIEFPEKPIRAVNTIYHNQVHASRIVAPVVNWAKEPSVQRIESNPRMAKSEAVIVDNVPLVYTRQVFDADESRWIHAPGRASAQLMGALTRLNKMLGGFDRVIKLNFFVTAEEFAEVIPPGVGHLFQHGLPACSIVVTPLPVADALVAVDAIAVAGQAQAAAVKPSADLRVLPAGSRLYVSGQAEKGASLREATRNTLEKLTSTLKHCGRSDQDVVQVKCFFQPMSAAAEVRSELEQYFGGPLKTPPVSFVEWKMPSPIEIELVATGGPANENAKESLEFITPPGMTASPVFSRVARINRGGTIFFSDLFAQKQSSPEAELQASFEELRRLLEKTGSDFKHLAKATYYITDDEIGKAHNAIRPKYYDPARPPAASKAMVAGTGRENVRYVMDMIAVPTPGK